MKISELLDCLVDVCRQDKEFLHWSRFVEGNVRLGIGEQGFVVRFFGGELISIFPDNVPTIKWDYEIVGLESDWERIWKGDMDFAQSLIPLYASITVRGDRVRFAADIEAIARLTRLMPVAAAKLGVNARITPDAAEGDSNPWSTFHEVIGRYVDVGGVRTYYETIGDKGPVTFLAIHSAGRDCRQWQQFGDIVADAGQLVAPDLPGHGKSWPKAGNFCLSTTDEMVFFLWNFRNAAAIKGPTVVVGCSIGGNLVFQLAAEHPDEVNALISFQGTAYSTSPTEMSLALMDHPRINPAYYFGAQTISLTGKRAGKPERDYLRWDIRTLNSICCKTDLSAYAKFDFREHMHQVRCPALLIRGQDDWAVSAKQVDETAKLLTNAKVVEVVMPEGLGHYANLEQPAAMGRLVLDFLRRNSHGWINPSTEK